MRNKRGQLAIIVIIAMVLVGSLVLFYAIGRGVTPSISPEENPEAFIEKCVKDSAEEAIDILLPQGGFIEPDDFKLHNNIRVSYLCKNTGNYNPCVNYHPMLLTDIKKEIVEYAQPRVELCLLQLKEELEKRQYDVSLSESSTGIEFGDNRLIAMMGGRITIQKGEDARVFEGIEVKINSPLYNLARVAMDIVENEAKYCFFENLGYMAVYPRFDIRRQTLSDSTRVYNIKDKESGKEMNIAIRGCVIPAGL